MSNEQIIHDLRACLMESNLAFKLMNTYKGVPFIANASLQNIKGRAAEFLVQPPFSITLKGEERTFMLSDGVLEPVDARVEAFDLATGLLTLSDFAYASARVGNRMELRVEPGGPIAVGLETGGQELSGELVDISMSGVGVRLATPEPALCQPGREINLTLHLPVGLVQLPGRVHRIVAGEQGCRLAVNFTRNVPDKVLILRYISQRRTEIQAEVQAAYEAELRRAAA